jgi:activator of Hsp90 ATPase-like protein
MISWIEPIRQTVTVRSDPERAFHLFTEQMGTWWPVEAYSRAASEFEEEDVQVASLEFQPRLGGSILEHMSDDRTLPWADIVAWDPPHSVLLAWRPHSEPEPPTEVEVTFTAGELGTLVQVEHRGWERLSEDFGKELHEIYVRGWVTTLGCFAAAAD